MMGEEGTKAIKRYIHTTIMRDEGAMVDGKEEPEADLILSPGQ